MLVVLAVAGLTLGPRPVRALDEVVRLLGLVVPGTGAPSRGAVERVGNVVLFVPPGLLAPLLLPRARRVVLVGGLAALSVALEVVQATLLVGRYPSVRDVALNTLGAGLGVLLGRRLRCG